MKFLQTGTNVLTAAVTDGLGRTFTYEQTIEVYPVLHLKLTADAATHTDEQISITLERGTAEDIKPYIDPKFDQNILLTQTERVMVGRNKIPKYNINKNVLVIGGSGSGKTRFYIKPNLMQMNASYIVTDPKGLVF